MTAIGGLLIGLFAIIVLGLLFFYFGIPAIRSMNQGQVTIPVEVNVKQTP